jgi:hypothetical protein
VPESWCRTPSTVQRIASPASGSISSGVTTTGPTGVVRSKFFPWNHSEVRPCQSRTEMSFMMVYPAIAARAWSGVAWRRGEPITTVSSASQSIFSDSSGMAMGSVGPMSAVAYFAKIVGCSGISWPTSSAWS